MDLEASALQDLGARNDWPRVASALLRLEAVSQLSPEGRPWVQVASHRSGLTKNQVRRMARVYAYVQDLVASGSIPSDGILHTIPFSHLEAAMRIRVYDAEGGLRVFRREWPDVTYLVLLERLRGLRDAEPRGGTPMIAGLTSSKRFRQAALAALRNTEDPDLRTLVRMEPTQKRIVSNYASPDFLLMTDAGDGATVVDAVDCFALHGPLDVEETLRQVLKVATESTFFRHFWAVFPDGGNACFFESQAAALSLHNVGTITVDAEQARVVRHRSPTGQAVIDRRAMWLAGRV